MSLSKTESNPLHDLNDSGCVQDSSVCENGYKRQAQLLDLSDDVLLDILKHCSPMDLKALGFSCLRLAALVSDHTLWQRVDCRDSRSGQQRLRWLLTHCLYAGTTELKIKGYVDTNIKCLGIQEPFSPFPLDNRPGSLNSVPNLAGTNMVDNVLFRMWYPHLPRLTVSPRWPDRSGLADSENVDKANTLDLSESSNKMDEANASVSGTGSSVLGHAGSSIHEPSSSRCDKPDSSKCDQPSSSKCSEPATSKHSETDISKHSEPATSKHSETDISKHSEMDISKLSEPGSSKYIEPSCSKFDKTSSSKCDEASYSREFEASGSKYGEVKHDGETSARGPSILNSGGPGASNEADMPMDVTVSRSTSGPSPRQSRPFSKPSHNCPGPQFTFSTKLMRDIKYTCTQLTALFIEYCDIDYKATNISHFPPKLKKLSLRGTRCYNQPLHSSYLCKIQDHLPDLEYLDVSACDWFEPASLMPVSKVPKLEELYMCRCVRLTECVAYASLAARYGFRRLRVLDARESPLADSEVSALGWLPLLEELYVAPPVDETMAPEHMHGWREWLPGFQELDQWELEEPDYFKSKTFEVPDSPPPPEDSNGPAGSQPSAIAEIREHRPPGDAVGDRPWGCYERRIIVIQPNEQREMVVQPHDAIPIPPLRRLMQEQEAASRRRGVRRPHHARPLPDQALDLVKRPRLEEDAERLEEGQVRLGEGSVRVYRGAGRHTEGPPVTIDDVIERGVRLQEACGRRPDHAVHELMQPGAADGASRPFYHNHCYDLVTDSAVFRFGRGENEHVVHLGLPPVHEARTRPDRSNLRVLSLTGFRSITDRSLVHLATAAPRLRLVDFTQTNVTAKGVDVFKAIRSDCEVKYSKFV